MFMTTLAFSKIDSPHSRLHPEAYKYLQNFSKHKQELAERLYALFNREVFLDELPHDMEIFWSSRLVKTAGRCHSKRKPGAASALSTFFHFGSILLFQWSYERVIRRKFIATLQTISRMKMDHLNSQKNLVYQKCNWQFSITSYSIYILSCYCLPLARTKQWRRDPILVSPDFQDETSIEVSKKKFSKEVSARLVETKAGLNIGQAPKLCFNKSKRVLIGTYTRLYKTL